MEPRAAPAPSPSVASDEDFFAEDPSTIAAAAAVDWAWVHAMAKEIHASAPASQEDIPDGDSQPAPPWEPLLDGSAGKLPARRLGSLLLLAPQELRGELALGVFCSALSSRDRDLAERIWPHVPFAFLPSNGMDALMMAAVHLNLSLLRRAIPLGNPLAREASSGLDALSAAVAKLNGGSPERIRAVEMLVPVSDLRGADKQGRTALLHAARAGSVQAIELLLPCSDPLHRDVEGLDALSLSAIAGCADACRALLPHCDLAGRDSRGRTALMAAAKIGRKEIVELLAPASSLSARDHSGLRASDHARAGGHENVASLLDALWASRERAMLGEAAAAPGGGAPRPRPRSL